MRSADAGRGARRGFKRVDQEGDHLHLGGADLGRVDFVSVAPSGRYAIFARDGVLLLIASPTGNLKPVTDGEFSMPARVAWHEPEGFAEVEYAEPRASSRIALEAVPSGASR